MKKTKLFSLVLLLFPLLVSCGNNPAPSPGPGPDPEPEELLNVNISAINDFHGAILEDRENMGLAKIGTYLKQRGAQDNTLTLDQGDDWQGSIYSNYNRGRLVNDVFAPE